MLQRSLCMRGMQELRSWLRTYGRKVCGLQRRLSDAQAHDPRASRGHEGGSVWVSGSALAATVKGD